MSSFEVMASYHHGHYLGVEYPGWYHVKVWGHPKSNLYGSQYIPSGEWLL